MASVLEGKQGMPAHEGEHLLHLRRRGIGSVRGLCLSRFRRLPGIARGSHSGTVRKDGPNERGGLTVCKGTEVDEIRQTRRRIQTGQPAVGSTIRIHRLGTNGEDEDDAPVVPSAVQVLQDRERRRIHPVKVVQEEDDGIGAGELVKELQEGLAGDSLDFFRSTRVGLPLRHSFRVELGEK